MTGSNILLPRSDKGGACFLQTVLSASAGQWEVLRHGIPVGSQEIVEYEVPVAQDWDPYYLLSVEKPVWKVLWKAKDSDEIRVGLGACAHKKVEDLQSIGGLRFYGGLPFFGEKFAGWSELEDGMFFLPEVEWVLQCERPRLLVRLKGPSGDKNSIVRRIKELIDKYTPTSSLPLWKGEVVSTRDLPPYSTWAETIQRIKSKMADASFQKVVLSRCKEIEFSGKLCLPSLLRQLGEIQERSFLFALQAPSGAAFVGRSPERLLSWKGQALQVDAMAGTRKRGATGARDRDHAHDLRNSSKDKGEHRLVVDYIARELSELCSAVVQSENQSIHQFQNVQHMVSSFKGIIKPGVSPLSILHRLHPTPAVGGFPTIEALEFLQEYESYQRGLFAGPIGWSDGENGDFAIAIRSAHWSGEKLQLFGGAGIVEGSDEKQEWIEAGIKMKNFLDIFELPVETSHG